MDFKVVLVERVRPTSDQIVSSSGILIDEKFVLVTSNLFMGELKRTNLRTDQMVPGKLYSDIFKKSKLSVNVLWKNGQRFEYKNAKVLSMFAVDSVRRSEKDIFHSWAIDTIDNNSSVLEMLSLFFVAVLESDHGVGEVRLVFEKWWREIRHLNIKKGDAIRIDSAPFGSRIFLDSRSKGIVSNVLGHNSCFIISDCPTTPGSEGSPVYLDCCNLNNPFGIVLSSANWWRGEWLGLTVILDIRILISEIIKNDIVHLRNDEFVDLAPTELSLVQVYSGSSWGTGILLNENGIFITNSHILTGENVILHHSENSFKASLIFKTPEDEVYDLAVVQCEEIVSKAKMKAIVFAGTSARRGDTVYAAGFSIFSRPTPTLSKGCVSAVGPSMLKTTCCVHAGASGGAILNECGHLLGVIVCNVRMSETNAVFARVNMAIPTDVFREVVLEYTRTKDATILNEMHTKDMEAQLTWRKIEGKL